MQMFIERVFIIFILSFSSTWVKLVFSEVILMEFSKLSSKGFWGKGNLLKKALLLLICEAYSFLKGTKGREGCKTLEVLLNSQKNGKMSTPLFGTGKKFKKGDIEYLCDFAIFFNKLLTRQQK